MWALSSSLPLLIATAVASPSHTCIPTTLPTPTPPQIPLTTLFLQPAGKSLWLLGQAPGWTSPAMASQMSIRSPSPTVLGRNGQGWCWRWRRPLPSSSPDRGEKGPVGMDDVSPFISMVFVGWSELITRPFYISKIRSGSCRDVIQFFLHLLLLDEITKINRADFLMLRERISMRKLCGRRLF